ncbi:MAG: hypothetical protein O3B01_17530 [Planctomycetota bacterium]|nr:hypothetical protein [Planctomycetota bacterium]MDA1140376.1 hypothetical protein [Planctomycetota bacterium]
MRTRKSVIIAVLAIAACWVGAAAIFSVVKDEPLSADQLLDRDDLTGDEIVITVSNLNFETVPQEQRPDVFRHIRRLVEKLPEKEREGVRERISDIRLEKMRKQWEHMTPEQQTEQIQKRLEALRQRRETISHEERERMKERLQSPEGQQFVKNGMKRFNEKLTPDERTRLTPLVKEILEQLESL